MSHNLTDRDGMFTVREAAWHGLGTVLDEHPTREQAKKIAHDWEPVAETIYRKVPIVGEDGSLGHTFEEISGFRANVRSDTAETLGVTSESYELVSNTDMYDIAELIQGEDKSQVKFETGGSLKGGAKVWLLLRLNEPLVVKGDPHGATIPYYALQNSHDGSGAFRGQATMTRIVCDNTSQMADMDAAARGTSFNFNHTKNIQERVEQARDALAGWRDSISRWHLLSETLMAAKVEPEAVIMFVEKFIPMPLATVTSDRVRENVRTQQLEMLSIFEGRTMEGIADTAYGLVQAAAEFQQHYRRAQSRETRFKRAYLDTSDVLAQAQEIACELAGIEYAGRVTSAS